MNILIIILKKISRLIYNLIPEEFTIPANEKIRRSSIIYNYYLQSELNDCYEYFRKYFKHSMLFFDVKRTQDYAIKLAIGNDKENNRYATLTA